VAQRRAGHTGFKSKAQWRLFFANPRLRRWAHQKAHATPGGPVVRYRRLPARKGARTRA
jgi:hypothetical protein